jgi:hypothetical protein
MGRGEGIEQEPQKFSICSSFGDNFEVNHEEFPENQVARRHNEADDGHEKARDRLAIDDHIDGLLHGFSLFLLIAVLKDAFQLVRPI